MDELPRRCRASNAPEFAAGCTRAVSSITRYTVALVDLDASAGPEEVPMERPDGIVDFEPAAEFFPFESR